VTVILAFLFYYYRSRFGRSMRAIEQSREGAVLMGVRPEQVINRSFVFSALTGALCGVLATPLIQMAWSSGSSLGVKGFTVAILGGLSNPLGVLVGGLLLGLVETSVATYINPLYKDAIALVLLLVMLIAKPSGLLGRKEKVKL
jgi:branched-chain amino acid transport system permease protein